MRHTAARENGAVWSAAGWLLRRSGWQRRLCQIFIAVALSSAAGVQAGEQCDKALTQSIRPVQSSVASLHSANSDAVALKLRLIEEACAHGRDLEAASRLEQLQDQLIAARKLSHAGASIAHPSRDHAALCSDQVQRAWP
jgi:hypothetical protein